MSETGSELEYLRLGVNIDHVATLRNARGGTFPDPVEAALLAIDAGADGITAHLREDRRHVRDEDIRRLKDSITKPLNLEMAATDEMVAMALECRPNAACIVPENREEVTTEGGLDVSGQEARIRDIASHLKDADIRVSLFVEADEAQLDASARAGADIVELHTGRYCHRGGDARALELARLTKASAYASSLGLECHAGHGLSFETVGHVAAIPQLVELNIGHYLIAASVFSGLEDAVRTMRSLMDKARS
jgi:pyridoxine 5-phosphate synthase